MVLSFGEDYNIETAERMTASSRWLTPYDCNYITDPDGDRSGEPRGSEGTRIDSSPEASSDPNSAKGIKKVGQTTV